MIKKVFYDGKCGLCSKEINYYKRIAQENKFEWIDITKSSKELEENNISLVEALKMLYVQDKNKNMHIGVDAFIQIWQELKYWHILAKFIALPGINFTANYLYKIFANWRFKKLEHCQIALKTSLKKDIK